VIPKKRATLLRFLVAATQLRRLLRLDVWIDPLNTGAPSPVVTWDAQHEAYGASWGCGSVSAEEIARMLKRSAW
jgi:hypothetical protein